MKFVRTELLLSVMAIAMAFLSGVLFLSLRQEPKVEFTAPAIEFELRNFGSRVREIFSFSPESHLENFDPIKTLPSYFEYSANEVDPLLKFEKDCKVSANSTRKLSALAKAWQWQEHKCGLIRDLPPGFFNSAPYIHPSGVSYASLRAPDNSWSQANLESFHVLEIKKLKIKNLAHPFDILVELDWKSLDALVKGEQLIIDRDYVLLRDDDANERSNYRVYKADVWNKFWNSTAYRARAYENGQHCFVRRGSVCWSYDVKSALFSGWNPLLLLFIFSVGFTLAALSLLGIKVKKRQQAQTRLQFALEMLAHEIRTPVTNLSMNVEQLRSDFNLFPQNSQSAVLKIFDQLGRLRRVIESSSVYLNKDLGNSVLKVQPTELSSLYSFIESVLEPYNEHLSLHLTGADRRFKTDPYLASICIKNLVENAIKHGTKPIQITVEVEPQLWKITIADAGTKEFSLKTHQQSTQGLGLGLKLVSEISKHIGAQFSQAYNPTKAKLVFEEMT